MPEFYMILSRKINKILEFYTIFARNARTLHNNCPKKFFSRFFFGGGGGTCPPCPQSSTPMSTTYLQHSTVESVNHINIATVEEAC